MRAIKFRGKTVKTAQWIFGDLDTQSMQSPRIMFNNSVDNCIYGIEVIPETVGQFTGLYDKHKTPIYEGDIVKTKQFGRDIEGSHVNIPDFDIFSIKFIDGCFRIDKTYRRFYLHDGSFLEVIGNIHDTKLEDIK